LELNTFGNFLLGTGLFKNQTIQPIGDSRKNRSGSLDWSRGRGEEGSTGTEKRLPSLDLLWRLLGDSGYSRVRGM